MDKIKKVKEKMKKEGYSFWDEAGNFKYTYSQNKEKFLIIGHRGHCIASEVQLNEAIKNHIKGDDVNV